MQTDVGQLIGTLQYMSPEQVSGNPDDIDIRSDVYALGIVLYQLLTGRLPYEIGGLSIFEASRIVKESQPDKPGTLNKALRGDVETILLKSLEKARDRRYQSASEFGKDVQNYLAGEAIAARPASAAYQLRVFARRHRGAVTAGVAAFAALLIGAVGFAWQAHVASGQRDRAVKAENETRKRVDELQKVSDFQSQMLAQVDPAAAGLRLTADIRSRYEEALEKAGLPEEQRAAHVASFGDAWSRVNATDTALELIKSTILQPALEAIDRDFADQPALNATLRAAVSSRYLDLGLLHDARAVNQEVIDLRRAALGEDHVDTLNAVLAEGKMLTLINRPMEAESLLRPLLESQQARLGPDHPVVLSVRDFLGEALIAQNKFVEAESLFRASLEARGRVNGDDHELTLMTMGNLAMVLKGLGKRDEAEAVCRDGLERRRRIYGEDHVYTLHSYNNLAVIYLEAGRLVEAADGFRKAAEGRRRVQGEAHRDTLIAANNLAATLGRLGKHEEAESLQRDILERARRVLGPDHTDALMALNNLASTLINLGKFVEAEPLCRELVERRVRAFGENNAGTIWAYNVMGFLFTRQKRYAEVEPFLRKAIAASEMVWSEDHPERLVLLLNMGMLSRDLGRLAESEQQLRDVLERCRRALGTQHPYTRDTIDALGETLFDEGKFDEVVQLLAQAEPDFRNTLATADAGQLRMLLLRLGKARAALAEFSAAEDTLKEVYTLYVAARGPAHPRTTECAQALIDLYDDWHAAEPSSGYDAKAAEWREKYQASIASAPASK